ncbi:hypothetical protein SCLCIDRAFT_1223099 [Scleroderma citrinum Foug A]|uniref:Uncharacterized protein n=1 Tax=Scleroderma citrinum Foug A TaxID=1036808 RepID=A0A0C2ZKE9_9AGAM|nr:hypothetical protein SCLCIDRAFT_1223099 [Scleroderma citrinum Foug A]
MINDGIDGAEAGRRESECLATTQPWCDLVSYYQPFLRTTKLMNRLSTNPSRTCKKMRDIPT